MQGRLSPWGWAAFVYQDIMDNVTLIDGRSDGAIADWLATTLGKALDEDEGPVTITVPGGSTPFPIMASLLEHDLDWTRLVVWPGDDRVVPEDHAAPNTGKLRDLFEPAGAEVVTLSEMEAVPRFTLAWLGMGADGHIASLFPNTDPQVDEPRQVVRQTPDPLPPEAPFDRISLTMPALLASDQLVFVIRGDEKRDVLEQAIAGESDLPVARLLAASRQPVTCFT